MNFQRGTSLIEVLVTVVVLSFGLLGLAGLQSRLQLSDMESYQRAQALVLLDDMANRIATNRAHAADYVTSAANPLGTGMTCPTSTASQQQIDKTQWCNALQGSAEAINTPNGTTVVSATTSVKVGSVIGARGCVEQLSSGEYLVTVAWQGLAPISAPPTGVACGATLYNDATASANATCTSDRCRRAVTTVVRIATLT